MSAAELALLPLRIVARSPLAFVSRKPGEQFQESLPYVPGGAIYGAIGRLLKEDGASEAEIFAAVSAIRCHNAYPARPGDDWSRPLPLTALQAKNSDQEVRDWLAPRVCWERQEPPDLLAVPTDALGRPWEFPGWEAYAIRHGRAGRREVGQRVLTRVAINRRRGTAENQRLFSPLVISEQQLDEKSGEQWDTQFLGSIAVDDPGGRVARLIAGGQLRHLGARQSTGLGAVTVTPGAPAGETAEALLGRVAALTERFRRLAQALGRHGGSRWEIGERTIFTVNLLADTILLEEGWLPTLTLSRPMLEGLTGVGATLLRSFVRPGVAAGWNQLWHRHKPSNQTATMGGLYLFEADAPLDLAAAERLLALQRDGIGERRAEGFGQVRICDEFHLLDPAAGEV